ncbi:MAG: pilin [Candidatus Doudnabacteria bacterium]
MKKLFSILFFLAIATMPVMAIAASDTDKQCPGTEKSLGFVAPLFHIKICSLNELAIYAVNFLLSIIAVFSVLFIVIGGFRYVTSNGNEEAASKGRQTITNAIIGLVIAMLSYTIIRVSVNTFSNSFDSPSSGTTQNQDQTPPQDTANQNQTSQAAYANLTSGIHLTGKADGTLIVNANGSVSDIQATCPDFVGATVTGRAMVTHSVLDSHYTNLFDMKPNVTDEMSVNGNSFSAVLNWAAGFNEPLIRNGETDSSVILHLEYDPGAGCSKIEMDKTYNSSELISSGGI